MFLQMRWLPFDIPSKADDGEIDFVEGLETISGAGNVHSRDGLAVYIYTCNASMLNKAFYSADGDFLIGEICIEECRTESKN